MEVKILATTLALGIVIDAVVVRGLLAPALVAVLGHLNWTMPRLLARLVGVDTPEEATANAQRTCKIGPRPPTLAGVVSGFR